MYSWFLESNYKDQNSFNWRFIYIIGKILELKCPKWSLIIHLDTLNINYGQKKGWE
jgi:hypothetical protein